MEFVLIKTDNKITKVNKQNLVQFPYFAQLFRLYPDLETYPLDIDYESLLHLLEFIRGGEYPVEETLIYDKMNSTEIDCPDKFKEVNVRDYIFYTTKYITYNVYIDRSPKCFKHILSYLRNPVHKIPYIYQYDLESYGIEYNPVKLEPKIEYTPDKIHYDSELYGSNYNATKPEHNKEFVSNIIQHNFRYHITSEFNFINNSKGTNIALETFEHYHVNNVYTFIHGCDLYGRVWMHLKPQNDQRAKLSDIQKIEYKIGGAVYDVQNKHTIKFYMHTVDGYCLQLYKYYRKHNELFVPIPLIVNNQKYQLPIIALQYHEVKLLVVFKSGKHYEHKIMVEHIFLDFKERRYMAQNSHEFAIEQSFIHKLKITNTKQTIQIMEHSLKYIIFEIKTQELNPLASAELFVDGCKIFHTNSVISAYDMVKFFPSYRGNKYYIVALYSKLSDQYNIYRKNSCELVLNLNCDSGKIVVRVVTCNVLMCMSGMCGSKFINN